MSNILKDLKWSDILLIEKGFKYTFKHWQRKRAKYIGPDLEEWDLLDLRSKKLFTIILNREKKCIKLK